MTCRQKNVAWARTAAAGALLAELLTCGSALAFRTGEDSPSLAGAGRVNWSSNRVSFYLSRSTLPRGIAEADAEQALAHAMDAWQAPGCSALVIEFAGWTDDAPVEADQTNTIGWLPDWRSLGLPPSVPGNTDLLYHHASSDWAISEADIWLDATSDWSSLSLRTVLTHELGHAIGLKHPCEDNGKDGAPSCSKASAETQHTTMFPDYDPDQASLEADDIAGLCYLYPADDECQGKCGVHELCVSGACRVECRGAACGEGEACGAWGCAAADGCLERDCTNRHCEKVTDCGPVLGCVAGRCSPGSQALGDACKANADCATAGCVAGICQPLCQKADDCGPNGSCDETDDGRVTACVASGAYPVGARCVVGADCSSGFCLSSDAETVCSNACTSEAQCPAGWDCAAVQGRQVCKPPQPSSACTVTGVVGTARRSGPSPLLASMIFLFLAGIAGRRTLFTRRVP